MKKYFIILLFLFIISCGNTLVEYKLLKAKSQNITKKLKRKNSILIYNKNQVQIYMSLSNGRELENIVDELKIFASQKYYRLPALTYIQFYIQNNSKKIFYYNLTDSYFSDEFLRRYSIVKKRNYEEIYTSEAYSRFQYDIIFSSYKNNKIEKKKKYNASKMNILYPKETAKQTLPYHFFSIDTHQYIFHFSINHQIYRVPLIYFSEREGDSK